MKQNETSKLVSTDAKGVLMGSKRKKTVSLSFGDLTEGMGNEEYQFTFHHPTLLDRMNIGVLKADMLRGMPVDVLTDNIAHMTATLTYVIDESPKWFKVNEVHDYEILDRVYEEYNTWYNTFRRKSDEQG